VEILETVIVYGVLLQQIKAAKMAVAPRDVYLQEAGLLNYVGNHSPLIRSSVLVTFLQCGRQAVWRNELCRVREIDRRDVFQTGSEESLRPHLGTRVAPQEFQIKLPLGRLSLGLRVSCFSTCRAARSSPLTVFVGVASAHLALLRLLDI
jgi:hypothetical protein